MNIKDHTPIQSVCLTSAIRAIETARKDLAAAGEGLAAMKLGAILQGLK